MRTKHRVAPDTPHPVARPWLLAASTVVLVGLLSVIPVTVAAVANGGSRSIGRAEAGVTTTVASTATEVAAATSSTSASLTTTPAAVAAADGPSAPPVNRHRVLAFLYPWFGPGAPTDRNLSVHPSTDLLTYRLDSSIEAARTARAHGVDGFVLSYAGAARQGLALHQTLEAASATAGSATVVIETRGAGTADVVERWVRDALRQSDHPAFERVNGVPVIFAFASGTIPTSAWGAISDQMAAEGHPVKIIGDVTPSSTNRMAGQYRYNVLMRTATTARSATEVADWNQVLARGLRSFESRSGSPQLVVATVQPGWDDRPARGATNLTVERNGTSTYDQTWAAAIAANPDWVVITSWNEWYEGTGIAASREHGTAALAATTVWAQRFKLGPTSSP